MELCNNTIVREKGFRQKCSGFYGAYEARMVKPNLWNAKSVHSPDTITGEIVHLKP